MHKTYNALKLSRGAHAPDSGQGCLLEITSCLYGEAWSDSPPCVSPSLAAFGRTTQDWFNDEERQLLLPFTVRLGNTVAPALVEQRRVYAFADFAVRIAAPIALEAVGLNSAAHQLRDLALVDSSESARSAARSAGAAARAAGAAARAARFAARSAGPGARFAGADARFAAWSAARFAEAAAGAARAAGADARFAARSAALSAARSAGAAGADARSELVKESVALLDRLCPALRWDRVALRWDRVAHIVSI
jgi:hypothetical protein